MEHAEACWQLEMQVAEEEQGSRAWECWGCGAGVSTARCWVGLIPAPFSPKAIFKPPRAPDFSITPLGTLGHFVLILPWETGGETLNTKHWGRGRLDHPLAACGAVTGQSVPRGAFLGREA